MKHDENALDDELDDLGVPEDVQMSDIRAAIEAVGRERFQKVFPEAYARYVDYERRGALWTSK